jgi:hypothetical protein
VGDPGRELLGSVRAPLEADVVDALGLGVAPSPDWIVDGSPVDPAAVHDAHLEWYGEHPQWVRAGLERHAERLGMLGL